MAYDAMPGCELDAELNLIRAGDGRLVGVIAVHSTALGPAAGGCRLWHYPTQAEAITDALRLARGMTFKNALAALPFGGGKTVLMAPAADFDRTSILEATAHCVASLQGRYVIAEDVGTTVSDMELIRQSTSHVAGLSPRPGKAGGDPSAWTALGVFLSIEAACELMFGRSLRGLTVAVQGLGNVGSALSRLLSAAGATVLVADVQEDRAQALAAEVGGIAIGAGEILSADADIVAPCALGAVLNPATIPTIKAKLVCGAANNQLANAEDGLTLLARGIVYAPDYVVNAGGIINVAAEYLGESSSQVEGRVRRIPSRLRSILETAFVGQQCPSTIADQQARAIVAAAQRRAA